MKKRILALLLTLALVLPAVSCDVLLADPNGPATPTDSQSPSNTPKDTEKAPVSVTPETQPQTPPDDEPEDSEPNRDPDEAQTEYVEPETEYIEPETTVEPETEEPLPYVEPDVAGKRGQSIDTFFTNGEMYFEHDGAAGDKLTAQDNKVVFKTGEVAQSVAIRGWTGFPQAIVSFGYYVDTYDFIYGEFAQATEDGVLAAGGENASRFCITVPLAGLSAGSHAVGFVVLLEDGTVVRLREELTVVIEKTMWDENRDIVVHQSFDELFSEPGRVGIFNPGLSIRWDFVATFNDFSVDTLYYWGWIAFNGELGQFGYRINGGTPIYDDAWAWETGYDVVNAAKGTGADSGNRMKIAISLAGLEGTNTVTVLYKNAEGEAVVLNDFTVILPVKPKDITDTYVADVNANEIGTGLDASDLSNYFTVELPLGSDGVVANGEGKMYAMTAISDMYADVNGKYFFKTNVVTAANGYMFVRGYKVVNSDAIIEKFDPAGGFYKINNYYEMDGAGAFAGAGIFARVENGVLNIMIKYYTTDTVTRVANRFYSLEVEGTELTMADDGETVTILVDGKVYATIALSGSITYADINEVSPKNGFAATAVVTLIDGTVETIENTLVADTCEAQIGMVVRAGHFKFSALEVDAYSAITIPEFEIQQPEDEPEDEPDEPFVVPEHTDEAIDLATGHGAPFSGAPNYSFGQKFDIGENFLKQVTIKDMATYSDGGVNTWTFKVYKWKGNYSKTIAADPVFSASGENHADNHSFVIDIPAELGIRGEFYYEITYTSGSGCFTGWIADSVAAGVETYVAGNRMEGSYASSIVVGVATATDEPETEALVIDMGTLGGPSYMTDFMPAGYYAPLQLLGYGVAIDLGQMDLSQFSAVKITYGCDGGPGTETNFANASSLAIGLKSENSSYGQETDDNFNGDIAHTDMVFSDIGWAAGAREAVVDLTNVNYNGNVWVAVHNPAGTEIAISAIVFVP